MNKYRFIGGVADGREIAIDGLMQWYEAALPLRLGLDRDHEEHRECHTYYSYELCGRRFYIWNEMTPDVAVDALLSGYRPGSEVSVPFARIYDCNLAAKDRKQLEVWLCDGGRAETAKAILPPIWRDSRPEAQG